METRKPPKGIPNLYRYIRPINEDEFTTKSEQEMYKVFTRANLEVGDVVQSHDDPIINRFIGTAVQDNKFFILPKRFQTSHFTSFSTEGSGVSGSLGGRIKRKSCRKTRKHRENTKRRHRKKLIK